MTSAAMTQTPPWTAAAVAAAASLYVGDLHPEVTKTDLFETFSRVVPVASVHKSLCYAYVNFFSVSDASKALACLNHTEMRGKPMRIMWSQTDPSTRKSGTGNLYVKNLDPSVTSADLEKLFSEYGTILSCKVAKENGRNKGFGYVQFDSEDSAMRALEALHGTLLEGKHLYVSKFIKKSDRKGTLGEETFTNLYVKNLDDHLTEDILEGKFSEHGEVCRAVIVKDYQGKSRGFGFVQFGTHQEAMKAKEALNGAQIGSKTLFVERANRQDLNLYVKNLDISIDGTKLKEIFSAYGRVTSAEVITDDKGVSRGFGFVSFTSAEEAKKALDSLNGITIQGLPLYVAFTRHREERSRQLQNRHEKYLPELFYTSNSDSFTPRYHTPNCNFLAYPPLTVPPHYNFLPCPPITVPYLIPQQLLMHRNSHRHVTAFYPFGLASCWGNHSASVPLKRSQQETVQRSVYPCNTMKSDGKPYISVHDHNSQTSKYQKSSRKGEVKNIHCSRNESSRGSAFEKPPVATSSTRRSKNIVQTYQPKVQNIQEHEAKTTVTLLEMSKSDAQRLLNSPHSLGRQVEKAVQTLKAANSQSG